MVLGVARWARTFFFCSKCHLLSVVSKRTGWSSGYKSSLAPGLGWPKCWTQLRMSSCWWFLFGLGVVKLLIWQLRVNTVRISRYLGGNFQTSYNLNWEYPTALHSHSIGGIYYLGQLKGNWGLGKAILSIYTHLPERSDIGGPDLSLWF